MRLLWKKVRHNQAFAISTAVTLIVVIWIYGCSSTVVSIVNPPERLTRPELKDEVDAFLARAKTKFESLDRQDKLKSTIFNASIEFLQGSTVNPVGVAITLGNVLGLGLLVDNRRKDVRIKSYKKEIENAKTKVKKTEAKKTS